MYTTAWRKNSTGLINVIILKYQSLKSRDSEEGERDITFFFTGAQQVQWYGQSCTSCICGVRGGSCVSQSEKKILGTDFNKSATFQIEQKWNVGSAK